jgi:hypothetical protein
MITAATFQEYKRTSATTYQIRVRLTDSTEGTYDRWFSVSGTTLQDLTNDARRQIADLNDTLTTKDLLAGIAAGTAIAVTRPAAPAPPAPTAAEVWVEKARRLARAKAMQLPAGNAASDAIASLEADVIATYQAGFGAQL